MHRQLEELQGQRDRSDRDWQVKESQLRAQVTRLRDEKVALEKQLYDTEFLLGDRDKELQRLKDEFTGTANKQGMDIVALE